MKSPESTKLTEPEPDTPARRSHASKTFSPEGAPCLPWHELYPFELKNVRVAGHRYHYIDELTGEHPAGTLLFVHGNPTWSFHWRALIAALRPRYRCVAVDHVGCGFSERTAKPLRLADHIAHLEEFIGQLDLKDTTLVAQDWGGAIGLGALLRQRERFSRVVLFNTGAFRPWFIPWRIRVCRTLLLGRLAVQGANLFVRAALTMTLARSRRLAPAVRDAYLAPYASWGARRAVYDFVDDIPASPRHPTWQTLERIESGLASLDDLPILLVWGMRDWCFTPACLDKFREFWPHAEVHRLEDVGHWVVEDAPEEACGIVERFLAETDEEAAGEGNGGMQECRNEGKGRVDVPPFLHSSIPSSSRGTTALAAYLACALEATAPKPGNVHPHAAFRDLSYDKMLHSAAAISPVLAETRQVGVGRTMLHAVEAMRGAAGTNAHLGAILLLAPLSYVGEGQSHRNRIPEVLAELDEEDTRFVYEAIRLAHPGGLGESAEADVREAPPWLPLVEVMRIAADRDLVARQYTNGFATVFDEVARPLEELLQRGIPLADAIVHVHLELLAAHGDSLIARKCGAETSRETQARAVETLAGGEIASRDYREAVSSFDAWLRADGNRRNPGTTADLIAAGLFVLLREGRLDVADAQRAVASAQM